MAIGTAPLHGSPRTAHPQSARRSAQTPPTETRRAGPPPVRDTFEPHLGSPIRQRELIGLPAETRQHIIRRSETSPEYASAARTALRGSTGAQRLQLGRVLGEASPQGARDLAALGPSRLSSRDSRGQTMLSNLDRLATAPLDRRLDGWSRQQLVDGALADTARPQTITQGAAGSCGVTSVFQPLARDQPAEYARISADLATSGRAQLRGGRGSSDIGPQMGNTLELVRAAPPQLSDALRDENRSATSRILQNAGLENANGPHATYDPERDRHSWGGSGVMVGQPGALASQLYGTRYGVQRFEGDGAPGPGAAEGVLRAALARSSAAAGPVIADVRLRDGGSHAIEVQRLANGVATVRDPNGAQGAGGFPAQVSGATATAEPGVYTIPVSALASRLRAVEAPAAPPAELVERVPR
ncbi:MAG: hypothetical protein JNK82_28845 [Myxococcaceae bacterium]|nr:hypothetical protein [Myxococcaceae bacterium]